MCQREFIATPLQPVPATLWDKNPLLGSGVGQQLNKYWVDKGRTIYGVKDSAIIRSGLVAEHESVMNVEERKKNPWIIVDNNRKVVGMATIPRRVDTLESVIQSLYNQVDIIELSLNGFLEVPAFLKNYPKVYPTIRSNEKGDANKFAAVHKYKNDYFFSCDDDIIYPADYVKTYIKAVDKWKSLVTIHGARIMGKIKRYYQDRTRFSHCLRKGEQGWVHIPGSGVSAFHTSHFMPDYARFEAANMADIFLAIQCEEKRIKRVSIAHEANWVLSDITVALGDETIYEQHKDNDSIQTRWVNSIRWSVPRSLKIPDQVDSKPVVKPETKEALYVAIDKIHALKDKPTKGTLYAKAYIEAINNVLAIIEPLAED
jgi:hypothetical protein